MTAYIDNIIIQGTPEEIQEFIELRNQKPLFGNTDEEIVTAEMILNGGTGSKGFDCTTKKVDATNT